MGNRSKDRETLDVSPNATLAVHASHIQYRRELLTLL